MPQLSLSPTCVVFVFFFKLRINVYLPEFCARREVFSILFIALFTRPLVFSLFIYALVCVPCESRGSVILAAFGFMQLPHSHCFSCAFQTTDASTFTSYHLEICYNLLSADEYPSIGLLLQVYTILLLYHHFSSMILCDRESIMGI